MNEAKQPIFEEKKQFKIIFLIFSTMVHAENMVI